MAFDLAGARDAGYSDAEIATYLGGDKFDTAGALKAGYSPSELIEHLSPDLQAARSQPRAAASPAPTPVDNPILPSTKSLEPLSDEEATTAMRPAVMTRNIRGGAVLQANTSEPEPEPKTADWSELSTLPAGMVAGGKNAAANLALAFTEEDKLNRQIALLTPLSGNTGSTTRMTAMRKRADERNNAALEQATAAGEQFKDWAEQTKKEMELVTPANMSTAQQAVWSFVSSAPPTAMGLAVGILTKNPALAMVVGGGGGYAMQTGQAYGEALDAGVTHRTAAMSASVQGLIELFDAVPIGVALKPGSSFLKKIAHTMGAEAGTESLQQGLQDLTAFATYKPEMTLGEAWQNMKVAALAGSMGGAVYGTVGHVAQPKPVSNAEIVGRELQRSVDATSVDPVAVDRAVIDSMRPNQSKSFVDKIAPVAAPTSTIDPRVAAAPIVAPEVTTTDQAIAAANAVVDTGTVNVPSIVARTPLPNEQLLVDEPTTPPAISEHQAEVNKILGVLPGFNTDEATGVSTITRPDGQVAPVTAVTSDELPAFNPSDPEMARKRVSREGAEAISALLTQGGAEKVLWVQDHNLLADGYTWANGKTVVLSDNPQRAASFVAGHELTHLLQDVKAPDGTPLHALLVQQVEEGLTAAGEQILEQRHGAGVPLDATPAQRRKHLIKEAASDLGGWALQNPQFVKKMFERIVVEHPAEAKSTLKKFIGGLKETINKVRNLFRAQPDLSNQIVGNLTAVHDTLEKMYATAFASKLEQEKTKVESMRKVKPEATAPPAVKRPKPAGPSVADIHAIAEKRGVPWDNDPAFMAMTKQVTGKEHLDDLTPAQRKLMHAHIKAMPEVVATSAKEETGEGAPPAVGSKIIVYRLGNTAGALANRNAGNARSVASYLEGTQDIESSMSSNAKTVYAYEVTVGKEFGDYEFLGRGKPAKGLGRRVERGNEVSYSFPETGYTARLLGSENLSDLHAGIKAAGLGEDFYDAGADGADVIRDTFAKSKAAKISADFEAQLKDHERAVREYALLKDSKDGKVLNTDIARELNADYRADRSQSAAVHEPASTFIKKLFKEKLAQIVEAGGRPRVLFTAGGTGAGKTTAIDTVFPDMAKFANIIYDTNMDKYASGKAKIEQVLAAGGEVDVVLVLRDPVAALTQGALTRAMRQEKESGTGRTVPIETHIATHLGAQAAVLRLAEEFKNNPHVQFEFIENLDRPAAPSKLSLAEAKQVAYNDVAPRVTAALEQEYANEQISKAVYDGFKNGGRTASGLQARVRGPDGGGSEEGGRRGQAEGQGPEAQEVAQSPKSDVGHKRESTDGRYVGAPNWVGNSPQKLAALRANLAQLAREGEVGQLWYEKSARAVLKFVNDDKVQAERFVGLLSIFSQGTNLSVNTTFALQAWYQHQAGVPIRAGRFPASQSKKAQDWLDSGKDYSGIKVNNFYQDLMEEIDPSKVDRVHSTMDMWMSLAFGYDSAKLDQGPKYGFAQREVAALAEKMGWRPHQVQAAIWTAMRARVNETEAGWRSKEMALGIRERNANGLPGEVIRGKETAHFNQVRKVAMRHDLTHDQVVKHDADYDTELQARTAQMSREAEPGRTTGLLPGLRTAPLAQKQEYLAAVIKSITGPNGEDLIAELAGISPGRSLRGLSAWEGVVGAGVQTMIPVHTVGSGEEKKVAPIPRAALDRFAALKGYVLSQDAVVWHLPIYEDSKIRHNGFEILSARALTADEMSTLYQAVHDKFGTWDIAPGYTDAGARLMHFDEGLANAKFQAGMRDVMLSLPPDFGGGGGVRGFRSYGTYTSNNWQENPNGEVYRAAFSGTGRPDVQGRAAGLRARVAAVNRDFDERYGWSSPTAHAAAQARAAGEVDRLAGEGGLALSAKTPEFKKWFGDSKVVDANGTPLVVYHGSKQRFTSFSSEKLGTGTDPGYLGAGYYFGERWHAGIYAHMTPEAARNATEDAQWEGDPYVPVGRNNALYPVYLSLQNPLTLDEKRDPKHTWRTLDREKHIRQALRLPASASAVEVTQAARAAGHDGVIFTYEKRNPESPWPLSREYVAFDPTQIKSAIGNTGTFSPTSADISASPKRSAITNQPLGSNWQDTPLTNWDAVVRKMQNAVVDTHRVQWAIEQGGTRIADNINPHLHESLFHRRAGKRIEDFANVELRGLLTDMRARGIKIPDLESFLHASHATERNAQIAKINPKMQDGGSGMTNAQAAAILAAIPPAKLAGYQALQARIDAITNKTLDTLVAYGLESQATVDAWRATYQHYVPLKRDMNSDLNYAGAFNLGAGTGQGASIRGPSSKRAMGSSRPVIDILANLATQRERAIVRGEKNRISQATYGLALKAPNPDFWLPLDKNLRVVEDANRAYAEWKAAEREYAAQVAAGANPADPWMTSLDLKQYTTKDRYDQLAPKASAAIAVAQQQMVQMGLNPADALAIAREPRERFVDPATGLVGERLNPRLASRDDVLALRVNGEDRFLLFSNSERAQAMVRGLKNLDVTTMPDWLSVMAKGTRWYAGVNTQFNPVFGLTNITRDVQSMMLNLQATPLKGQQAKVLKYTASALAGIYSDMRAHRSGKTPSSVWAQRFEEAGLEGGQTGYRDNYENSAERTKALESALQDLARKPTRFLKLTDSNPIFAWLSDYNTALENSTRLAVFQAAIEQGMSKPQAALLAKNITVNFNKKGSASANTGAVYAFFNAAVQGTATMASTMLVHKGDPSQFSNLRLTKLGHQILWGGIALGVIQALVGAAAGWDDDQPPEFQRETDAMTPVWKNIYAHLPMAQGFLIFPNIGRLLTQYALGGFKDPGKYISRLASVTMSAFNPLGNVASFSLRGLLQLISPTVVDPLANIAMNMDAFGQRISRDDFDQNHPTPGWTRSKDTATPWAKGIARTANYLSGGGKYGIGWASPTPDEVDYLIGQVTGGVGREVAKVTQAARAPFSGEDFPIRKWPVVGRFVGDTSDSSATAGRFYENLRRIGEHKSEIDLTAANQGAEAARAYVMRHPEARLGDLATSVQRDLAELHKMKRELVAKGDKARVQLVEERTKLMMQRFNSAVKAQEARP